MHFITSEIYSGKKTGFPYKELQASLEKGRPLFIVEGYPVVDPDSATVIDPDRMDLEKLREFLTVTITISEAPMVSLLLIFLINLKVQKYIFNFFNHRSFNE